MKKLLLGVAALAIASPATAQVFVENFDDNSTTVAPTDFTSDYAFVAYGNNTNSAADQYTVAPSAFPFNPQFVDFGDNTSGTGNYMVVNGGVTPPDSVWANAAPIVLNVGSRYVFSFALSNVCCQTFVGSAPQLGLDINTVDSGAAFTSVAPGVWNGQTFTFTATAANNTFSITSLDGTATGNDFGIDDISISAVPEPATWALMIMGFGAIGGALRRRSAVRTAVRFA